MQKTTNEFSSYALNVSSYNWDGRHTTSFPHTALLVSGSQLSYVPSEVARAFASAFTPSAYANATLGGPDLYFVDCTAKPPASFQLDIGGKVFKMDQADSIVVWGQDEDNDIYCVSALQNGTAGSYQLGDVFLHNVVTTFDLGKNEITVAQRPTYASV
jgi:hypothetical protein